jgi:hypothetical protein
MKESVEWILGEWRTISGAPATIVILVVIVAAGIWLALDWKYNAIINNLKEERDHLKEKLNRLASSGSSVAGAVSGSEIPIGENFKYLYDSNVIKLGKPRTPVQQCRRSYQSVHENAIVIWLECRSAHFALPTDGKRKVIEAKDTDWEAKIVHRRLCS